MCEVHFGDYFKVVLIWGPDVKNGFRGSESMLSADHQAVVPCSGRAHHVAPRRVGGLPPSSYCPRPG